MTDVRFEDTSSGPRRSSPSGGGRDERPGREPMFNAPWPALALVGAIVGCYAFQATQPEQFIAPLLGFSPLALEHGLWWTLLTSLFLHGSWGHALMNAAFALAFATPLARFFGAGARGALTFYAFYLACGVLATLGYSALHWGSPYLLVGASGAVSGLMGAASRIMAGGGWSLGPVLSRPVLGMGGAWIAINALIAVIGGALIPGSGSMAIAWEAHVAGFIAGVLIVWPFARIARGR